MHGTSSFLFFFLTGNFYFHQQRQTRSFEESNIQLKAYQETATDWVEISFRIHPSVVSKNVNSLNVKLHITLLKGFNYLGTQRKGIPAILLMIFADMSQMLCRSPRHLCINILLVSNYLHLIKNK